MKEKVSQDCVVEGCGKKGIKNMGVHMIKHRTKTELVVGSPEKVNPKAEIDIEEKLDAVISGLNSVAGAVSKLIELQTKDSTTAPVVKEKFNPSIDDETYPSEYMPPKFRKIVDETLSSDFGARVTDFVDRTDFQLDIIVPDEYSSVSVLDREKGVKDIRSRLIPRALGENGVKEWCMLIRKNLNRFYQREGVKSPFQIQA